MGTVLGNKDYSWPQDWGNEKDEQLSSAKAKQMADSELKHAGFYYDYLRDTTSAFKIEQFEEKTDDYNLSYCRFFVKYSKDGNSATRVVMTKTGNTNYLSYFKKHKGGV